jgi:hypothetical protein
LLKALDYMTVVEGIFGCFPPVGPTFPLLGERSGAITQLGDITVGRTFLFENELVLFVFVEHLS